MTKASRRAAHAKPDLEKYLADMAFIHEYIANMKSVTPSTPATREEMIEEWNAASPSARRTWANSASATAVIFKVKL